jgi:hypothetical protein
MFHPEIIQRRINTLQRQFNVRLHYYTPSESAYVTDIQLESKRDLKTGKLVGLTLDEQLFIQNEILLSRADFKYWFTRYAKLILDDATGEVGRPKLWRSQELMIKRLGEREKDMIDKFRSGHRRFDGNRWYVHKARQMGLCLKEGTKVLRADLTWVPIETIKPGDELIGVDEDAPGGRGASRKMRSSVVEATSSFRSKTLKITLDDGRTITATPQHRFMYRPAYATDTFWREVRDMKVGGKLRNFVGTWEPGRGYEDGWFGGILDGEGCLRRKNQAGTELSVTQTGGAVLERARRYLEKIGCGIREEVDERRPGMSSKLGNKDVHKLVVGQAALIMKILGTTRPSRMVDSRWWEGKEILNGQDLGSPWATIISIEEDGEHQVYDLQTSTKTFIAEGVISHNSSICEAINIHGCNFYNGTNCLVGSKNLPKTQQVWRDYGYLMWKSQPDWMRMAALRDHSETGLILANGSKVILQHSEQESGFGQGAKWHRSHLTEIADWNDNPQSARNVSNQIDNHYDPSISRSVKSIAFLESTSQGMDNYWHKNTERARAKRLNWWWYLFIPWWLIPDLYIDENAPEGWTPAAHTLEEESIIVKNSPEWNDGTTYHPSAQQLYWWEKMYDAFHTKGVVNEFYKNYPSIPEQSFTHSGRSSFAYETLRWCDDQVREPYAYYELATDETPSERVRTERELTTNPITGKQELVDPPAQWTIGTDTIVPVHVTEEERLSPLGLVLAWEPPKLILPHDVYAGVDTTGGIEGWSRHLRKKDDEDINNAAISFVRSGIVVDTDVLEFAAPITPKPLARLFNVLARVWIGRNHMDGQTPTIVEITGEGLAFQEELISSYNFFNYYQHFRFTGVEWTETSQFGWTPSPKSVRQLWSLFKSHVTDKHFIPRSRHLIREMRSCTDDQIYVAGMTRGKAPKTAGRHDDRVYSRAFAIWFANSWANPEPKPFRQQLPATTSQGQKKLKLHQIDFRSEEEKQAFIDDFDARLLGESRGY